MSGVGVWELCDKLRAERLLIASEIESLKGLHCDVRKKHIQLSLHSWKSCHLSFTTNRLLNSHQLVSPDNACAIIAQLDACTPIEAYKRLGHHYSNVGRILSILSENPQVVAELISSTEGFHNVSTEDLVQSVFTLIYGSGTYPEDEKRILEVLTSLVNVQLIPANNPRLILRKGKSTFPRLYKIFSESLLSVKIFLTAALHDSVMLVLCQDEIFLDIDPSKCTQRFPEAERIRRFGTDPTSAHYHKRILAIRKIIVEKLVLLAHSFIKNIIDSLPCFPECLVWLVQQMHRSLIENKRMSKEEAHLICTDLIITNLLCPAITNPETVGVISDTPISNIARFNLMQIGQIIQTLALSKYESPPPHFQTFTTQFSDSPICNIVETLLNRDCQGIESMYPVILPEAGTSGEDILKRSHFLGSVWEVNNMISVLQSDSLNSISQTEVKNEIYSYSNRLTPAVVPEVVPEVISHMPRQNKLKSLADKVHNSLSQSPTRSLTSAVPQPPNILSAEYFEVLIFDKSEENLLGMLPEDKFMEKEIKAKKSENTKKRARFVEDDSIVGSAVSDITVDNASDLEEEVAAQDEVGSVSSSQEAPQEDRMLLLDEDVESTLPDNVSDVGGISGRGSPSLSGRDTPLSQGLRDGPDNVAVSLVSGAEERAQRDDLPAVPVAVKKPNAEGLEEKFGKFNVPSSGTLGSCRDDQRSILSEAWSTNVVASDDESSTVPSGRALLAQLPTETYGNRQRPINRTGSMTGAAEDRSDTWSLDAVASDSEVDGRDKERSVSNLQETTSSIVILQDAPLIDVSVPPATDTALERRRSSGSSFSYPRSEDSEISRPNDLQSSSNFVPVSAEDTLRDEEVERLIDAPTIETPSQSAKKKNRLMIGLQKVGDKVRIGINNTPLRQLPQSSTISDFFGELRDKKKSSMPESHSENHLAELDNRTADDILAKYQKRQADFSPTLSPPLGMAPELPIPIIDAPYYDSDNLLESRAFLDAKRKLRLVLSSVGSLSVNRIADEGAMRIRQEKEKISVVLRTLLAEAVNSRQQILSAHVREVLRCLQIFDNKGIHLLLRTLNEELRQRSVYISYLQQSRLTLLRLMSYIDQLTVQITREKIVTEECFVDILVRFYLENKDAHLKRFTQEFTQLHAQDEKIESLNRVLNALFTRMSISSMWKDITPEMNEYLKKALERVVMSQIHGLAFYPNMEADRHRDEVFYKTVSKLARTITPDHPMLKIPRVFHGEAPWPSAQAEINILNAYKSARDKLACVVRCCETISNLVTMAGCGAAAADDVTPVLVYVLIQANPPALLSNVQYIQSFAGHLLSGAEGYWWTQFVSAIEFAKTLL